MAVGVTPTSSSPIFTFKELCRGQETRRQFKLIQPHTNTSILSKSKRLLPCRRGGWLFPCSRGGLDVCLHVNKHTAPKELQVCWERATKCACKDDQELRKVRVLRGRPHLHCITAAIGHLSQISVHTHLAQARALLFYFPVWLVEVNS